MHHNTNIPVERFKAQVYKDLMMEFIPGNPSKNILPKIIFNIFNYDDKDIYHLSLLSILHKCGYNIVDKNHTYDKNTDKYQITGYNAVGEAISALLDFSKSDVKNQMNSGMEIRLISSLKYIGEQIRLRDERKGKIKPGASKESSQYKKPEKIDSNFSIREVSTVKSLSKKKNEKTSYSIARYGVINEITSFNSEIFGLLLGSDHVGKARTVIDENGIRHRTLSPEIKDFQSLHELKSKFDSKSTFINTALIPLGLGKLEVAHHVFAEHDGHWRNVGIGQDKNGQPILARIDFDQTLWLKTSVFHGVPENKATQQFPVSQLDIDGLPDLTDTKPFNGLKKEIAGDKKNNDPIEQQLNQIKDNPVFVNDKWYTYLKYLLINDDMYKARADYCISSDKRRQDILSCLSERREEFKSVLLQNAEFNQYVLNNPDAINCILSEFSIENAKYLDKENKKSMMININDVKMDYWNIMSEINPLYKYVNLSQSTSYPESYSKLWIKTNDCASNVVSILNDYISPSGGWFLSGHWKRSNFSPAKDMIYLLNSDNKMKIPQLQFILLNEISNTLIEPETNDGGSYITRLKFCVKMIDSLDNKLEVTPSHNNTNKHKSTTNKGHG